MKGYEGKGSLREGEGREVLGKGREGEGFELGEESWEGFGLGTVRLGKIFDFLEE